MSAFGLSYKFVGFCVALALCGCTPYLYIPNPSNIPLPSGKNELIASTGLSSGGLYFQGSYALTNHIVIGGSYNSFFGIADSINTLTNNQFANIEAGYYLASKKIRFETIGGYGIGHDWLDYRIRYSFLGSESAHRYDVNNNYKCYTMQLDCNRFNKNFEAGFSFKLNYLSMKSPYFNTDTYIFYNRTESKLNYSLPNNALFAEPSIFLKAGSKLLKFQATAGWSFPVGSQNKTLSDLCYGAVASCGITVTLFGPKEK